MQVITLTTIGWYSSTDYQFEIPKIEVQKTSFKKYLKKPIKKNPLDSLLSDSALLDSTLMIKIDTVVKHDTIFKVNNLIKLDTTFRHDTIVKVDTIIRIDSIPTIDTMVKLILIPDIDTIIHTDTSIVIDTVKRNNIEYVMDTTSQRILLIGDSMMEGLMFAIRNYTVENKHKLKSVVWYSSSTEWYGSCDTISYFVKQFEPTYIIFVIGGNELFIRNITEKRSKYMAHIVKQFGDTKYICVGPPNWREDTGINDLIEKYAGEGRFFLSKNLTFQRLRDGAHPTRASSRMWMDSIASWIMNKSMYPIRMNKPKKRYRNSPNATLLSPKAPQ